LLLGFGFILALTAGTGTVVLLEGTDHSVRNRRDLVSLLQVAPLAILPYIVTDADRRRQRRRRGYAVVAMAGAGVIALALTHLFYRPLDVLWAVALRKLGG
jgi:succinoglycan biosynthesis transport protein ExoP